MSHESMNESTIRYIESQLHSLMGSLCAGGERPELKEILKKIYLDAFPEKSALQAAQAADTIMEAVGSYEREYREAAKNPDQWLKNFTDSQLQGRSVEDKYDILLRHFIIQREILARSANAAVQEEENILRDVLQRLEAGNVCIDDPSNELLQNILGRIAKLQEGSAVVFCRCEEAVHAVQSRIEHMDLASLSAGQLQSLEECLAVASMIGYVGCRSGRIAGVPDEASIRQITYEICAGMEMARIAEEMQSGTLTLEAAGRLLKLAGSIVCGFISQELISARAAAGCFLLGSAAGIVISAGAAAWVLLRLKNLAQKGKEAVKGGFYKIRDGVHTLCGRIKERIVVPAGEIMDQTVGYLEHIVEKVLAVDESVMERNE